MGDISAATEAPENPQEALQRKYIYVASVLGILQVLGLITAISLWQTGNEAASYVVLCVGYFSSYFLVLLGSFLETEALDLTMEVRFHHLQHKSVLTTVWNMS
jgi:hypothetical protein